MNSRSSTDRVKESDKRVNPFRMSRRNLPHTQDPGQTYFITFRTHDIIMPNEVLAVVMNSCLCCDAGSRAHPPDAIGNSEPWISFDHSNTSKVIHR